MFRPSDPYEAIGFDLREMIRKEVRDLKEEMQNIRKENQEIKMSFGDINLQLYNVRRWLSEKQDKPTEDIEEEDIVN